MLSDTVLKCVPVFLLTGVVTGELLRTRKNPALAYQLPFLISATFSVMVLPTLIANLGNSDRMASAEFLRFAWFALICMVSAIHFYKRFRRFRSKPDKPKRNISGSLLSLSLVPFLLVALASLSQINPTEYGSVLGGSFAIFLFFARLLRPIQVLAWGGFLLTRNRNCLAIFIVCVLSSLPFIFISGRRSDTLFLPLSILVPLWAINGKTLSPRQIGLGVLFVLFVFFLLPSIRAFTRNFEFSEVASISFSDELQGGIAGEGTNEVIEVSKDMAAVEKTGSYSYGVEFINKITFQYVSSTLFGDAVKAAFQFPQPDLDVVRATASDSHVAYSNSKFYLTRFGFGDAFLAFGWFGVFYFVAFGVLVAKLYDTCFASNDARLRLIYCVLTVFIPFTIYDSFSACPVLALPWTCLVYVCLYLFPKLVARSKIVRNRTVDASKLHTPEEIL
ncbi:hypothetical protein [Rhodopirellula halodulae]|uniref:hypothetical protein n=1 Tax=Rhodopirellula halodulae TaxID=2894198 RepID=UPI001E615AEA|nr:hypothetical protein [Rhodopirellula sp. JC737]MCC9656093.1 hypothetical protein [Rhodopirellula sp. JC737]